MESAPHSTGATDGQTPNSRERGLLEAQRVPQTGDIISLATEMRAVELGQFAVQYFR